MASQAATCKSNPTTTSSSSGVFSVREDPCPSSDTIVQSDRSSEPSLPLNISSTTTPNSKSSSDSSSHPSTLATSSATSQASLLFLPSSNPTKISPSSKTESKDTIRLAAFTFLVQNPTYLKGIITTTTTTTSTTTDASLTTPPTTTTTTRPIPPPPPPHLISSPEFWAHTSSLIHHLTSAFTTADNLVTHLSPCLPRKFTCELPPAATWDPLPWVHRVRNEDGEKFAAFRGLLEVVWRSGLIERLDGGFWGRGKGGGGNGGGRGVFDSPWVFVAAVAAEGGLSVRGLEERFEGIKKGVEKGL
ncbi:mucin 12, cell surface associated [Bachmanniomyces sp. S44760]|nr:mucin 12, cell surface associated [Bachmanniomyces sp. S44760]